VARLQAEQGSGQGHSYFGRHRSNGSLNFNACVGNDAVLLCYDFDSTDCRAVKFGCGAAVSTVELGKPALGVSYGVTQRHLILLETSSGPDDHSSPKEPRSRQATVDPIDVGRTSEAVVPVRCQD